MIKRIFLLFLFWRILLFIPLIIGNYFLTYRKGFEYTLANYFINNHQSLISNPLISSWSNFDGIYYLLIAANGYTVNAGFFPLFPLSINILSYIFGNTLAFNPTQYFTALTLVSLYFLLALIVMYKLIRLDFKKNIAIWSIFFMLVFPTSFFYASIYSESLFLFLSLLTFYFARKRRWFLAGITGAFLSATRPVGIAIFPALLYEYFKSEKSKSSVKLLSTLLTPLGLIAYAFYNLQKWGSAFYFITAQGNFLNNRSVNSVVFFPQTIFRYFKILTTVSSSHFEWWIALLEISTFFFVSFLFILAWKEKIRLSYLLFSIFCFLIPALSGTFTGLPRYSMVLFPLFIAIALSKNKVLKLAYVIIGIALLFVLLMLFSRGYYIS